MEFSSCLFECKCFPTNRKITARSNTITKFTVPETAIPTVAAVLSGLVDVWSVVRMGGFEGCDSRVRVRANPNSCAAH